MLDRAESIRPAVIVMDIGLPGIDGVEATRRLRAAPDLRDTPVVAVTAYAMPGDEKRMRDAGCDAYLTKPLQPELLASELARVLRVPAPASGPEHAPLPSPGHA